MPTGELRGLPGGDDLHTTIAYLFAAPFRRYEKSREPPSWSISPAMKRDELGTGRAASPALAPSTAFASEQVSGPATVLPLLVARCASAGSATRRSAATTGGQLTTFFPPETLEPGLRFATKAIALSRPARTIAKATQDSSARATAGKAPTTPLVRNRQRDRWRRGCCFGACNIRASGLHLASSWPWSARGSRARCPRVPGLPSRSLPSPALGRKEVFDRCKHVGHLTAAQFVDGWGTARTASSKVP